MFLRVPLLSPVFAEEIDLTLVASFRDDCCANQEEGATQVLSSAAVSGPTLPVPTYAAPSRLDCGFL